MKLSVTVFVLAVSFAASADTVAWWHFDECDPGTPASTDTIACDQAPSKYATPYSIASKTGTAGSGDYLPTYAKPFHGLAVYDPVTDTTRTNRAAMKFTTAKGGSSNLPAYYGGCLIVTNTASLLSSCNEAFTVEAYICTTGGLDVAQNFGPIVASVDGTGFTSEKWALYLDTESAGLGGLAFRINTVNGATVRYQGSATSAKVNDGAWHHVAYVYNGENVLLYVDHTLNKTYTLDKTGNISYGSNNAIYIGGYDNYYNSGYGYRRFPGLIDEVRVSNVALEPEQFLQMQPIDMDQDELVRVSFDPGEFGVLANGMNLSDMRAPGAQKTEYKTVSGAGASTLDTANKAGSVMAAKTETDTWLEDAASFYQATNGVGKANYVQMQYISNLLYGNDGAAASYTVEMFYKSRSTVRGTADNRQVLMKFSGTPYFNVLFNATGSNLLYVPRTGNANQYLGSRFSNADDGKWHHVAVVVDGTAQAMNFYFDYQLDKTQSGTLPAVGTGYSIFFGAKENGGGQWYDGWIDDIRVTRRVLAPKEFLTTHPVGTGDNSLLALFEQNYDFTCASNAAFNVTATGEARTGGNAPTFVKESRGDLILDGTNGSERATNEYSVRLNTSRVVVPPINLFELDSYTIEFWAKFDGIVDENGAVAADSTALAQHAPILRLTQTESTDYDWFFYRQKNSAKIFQMASSGKYGGWEIPSGLVVDGKWHHCALTFEPVPGVATNSYVQFFYDYSPVPGTLYENGTTEKEKNTFPRFRKRVAGHRLMIGEGTYEQPNIQMEFDAIRISKGVLTPDKFLGRARKGFTLIVR
ncbi:MAG: laminin G domain-containing protein [Kiritimatiellae bacterium]|nr:laminin G domain-containing protein [Kiritimatiellia bacterium]